MTLSWSTLYAVALALTCLSSLWVVGSTAAGNGAIADHFEQSEQWCDDHDGELHNSMSVVHGGLHCELENGTTVHMSEVVG